MPFALPSQVILGRPGNRRVVGGGSPTPPPPYPVWLPQAPSGDYPVVYGNFKDGHYWANGAVVGVDDVFYADTNWGDWDSSVVVPGSGIPPAVPSNQPAIVQALIAGVLGSLPATVVVTTSVIGADFSSNLVECDVYDTASFDFDASAQIANPSSGAFHLHVSAPSDGSATDGDISSVATLAMAFNVYSDQIVGSLNGRATITASGGDPGILPDSVALDPSSQLLSGFVAAIAVYASQPDADLPTLSTP